MKIGTLMTLAGLLALGAWSSPANTAWLQRTGNTKEYQQTLKELKQLKRNWTRTLRDISNTKARDIAWGKEKKAGRSQVVVLNPPLGKTVGSDRIEVEWFHSPIDDRGTTFIWMPTLHLVMSWQKSLEGNGIPVTARARLPGSGPGLSERFDEQRRWIQEMTLAWDGTIWGEGTRGEVYRAMAKRSSELPKLQATRDAVRILEEAGVDKEEWITRVDQTRTRKRIEEENRRYNQLATRGIEINPKVQQSPQDPILLIDGKYLLMGSVVGKTRDLFRIANGIIRQQAERLSN